MVVQPDEFSRLAATPGARLCADFTCGGWVLRLSLAPDLVDGGHVLLARQRGGVRCFKTLDALRRAAPALPILVGLQ